MTDNKKAPSGGIIPKLFLMAIIGIAVGILYDLLDMRDVHTQYYNDTLYYSFLGVALVNYCGWIIIELFISYKSGTAMRAALYCLVFTLFSQPATRLFEWAWAGFVRFPPDLLFYIIVSLFTAPCGWFVWHATGRKKSVLGIFARILPALVLLGYGVVFIITINTNYIAHIIPEGDTVVNSLDLPPTLYVKINRVILALICLASSFVWAFVLPKKHKRDTSELKNG